METAKAKLTVLFDPPFWAGLFEREAGGRYEACKVIFGPEPSDQEVYQYLLDHYQHLEFSPALPSDIILRREDATSYATAASISVSFALVRNRVRVTEPPWGHI